MESQEHGDANAPEVKGKGARTRRRPTAKAPTEAGKRSLNLRIDEDSYKRLSINAVMMDKTISELVMEFAQGRPANMREYAMPHRIGARAEQGE